MEEAKVKFKEISTDDFISVVFIFVTIFILSSIIWSDERDVYGYYQNLIIASFSIAPTILHICYEIRDHKNEGSFPPKYISFAYASCKFLIAVCCAVPICIYSMANKNTNIEKHLYDNKYWGICLITFIPVVYSVVWGYLYPMVTNIPYNDKIRYEDRPR